VAAAPLARTSHQEQVQLAPWTTRVSRAAFLAHDAARYFSWPAA